MYLRPKILDVYILRRFLTTFFFVVLIVIAVLSVIDYTEKSDAYIKHNVPWSEIINDYYLNFIPYILNMLSPIIVFITTVLVNSKLSSHTEIIAMLSSGMSFRRFLVPYIVGAVMLGGLIFYMVGWVVPHTSKKRVAFELKYIDSPFYYDKRNNHFKLNDSTYAYMETYSSYDNRGYRFTLETIKGQQLMAKLSSDLISWDSVKSRWHVDRYEVHTFDEGRETITTGYSLDTALNLYPRDFQNQLKKEATLDLPELEAFITEQITRGADNFEVYLNEKYERYAYPFAVIILTIMGVIISSRKSRRGTGYQIAIGFALAFLYVLFVITSRNIGQPSRDDGRQ
jgi:lipopolysaccharide export system permease protein